MFRELEFQTKVFRILDYYLEHLKAKKANADNVEKVKAENPSVEIPIPDFPEETWQELKDAELLPVSRANTPFSSQTDDIDRPVPNITLKVPTGGGKTWLAVKSTSMILNKYLGKNTGFILWIVPNEAIYTQTLKNFKDRDHPYRQAFDRTAAGRVKILTKDSRLNAIDVQTHLCVMVLMLQSANRQTKETLRIFRDRGDVHGFIPEESEQDQHAELLKQIKNLDHYGGGLMANIMHSLGNALRIIRPIVVMDEGHRATSDLARKTLYGFNPCFVLELTATPKDNPKKSQYANLLTEITGRELDLEGMIKMPINIDPRENSDWKDTLNAAVDKLNSIKKDAIKFQADSNRYIRPIMLVQVERTGKDQLESGYIHALDVRQWLMKSGSFKAEEIAIKTAEQNDLSQPENQDLLDPQNQIRVIITREALQEGWDCPFAYVLCSLAAKHNLSGMTQLVGRILRQPYAEKTKVESLDQCYVFAHQPQTTELIESVKNGLEKDGLGDLVVGVSVNNSGEQSATKQKINRRPEFKSEKIYLPKVLKIEDKNIRELDYETDVALGIDWRDYDPSTIANEISEDYQPASNQIQQIKFADEGEEPFAVKTIGQTQEIIEFDPAYATQRISDIVPNPFIGRQIIAKLLSALKKRGYDEEKLAQQASYIIEELRKNLTEERDKRAEESFKEKVENGEIEFRLRFDKEDWRMPPSIDVLPPSNTYPLYNKDGQPVKKSIFSPVYGEELNKDERDVAIYLDGEDALGWWHRNIAKKHYGIRGWKRGVVYPDFIFSVKDNGKTQKMVALEMKGDQLANNLDTEYKKNLMQYLTENFIAEHVISAGKLEILTENMTAENVTVECELILFSEWKNKLPELIAKKPS